MFSVLEVSIVVFVYVLILLYWLDKINKILIVSKPVTLS